ncbi:MAG: LysM peptidoglycan-binding domain-containing protein [Patescibacteria group bacterium]
MLMGILIVLAVGGLAYRYFQGRQGEQAVKTGGQEPGEELVSQMTTLPDTYIVANGDNLWSIAEKFYQSGYNWVDIAKENGLSNADVLLVDQKLRIPDVPIRQPTIDSVEISITGDAYTVQKGDSLSSIAKAAYGSGVNWPKIWGTNRDKIGNPNLIFAGTEIRIPR